MSDVAVGRRLEVLGTNKVIVPGCEPSSLITSDVLAAYQQRYGICKNATADLQTILDAIPGSYLEFGANFGAPRKRWLVLPPFDPSICPCGGETDWFGVIRNLASGEAPMTEQYSYCNLNSMGYCPSPEFDITPPSSTYVAEGTGAPNLFLP